MSDPYDRSSEDLYNIVGLEHVNLQIPDQRLATIFYIMGLGLTRDPYLTVGVNNMWINVGRSQFHTPTGEPQVLRGHVGLVMSDREALVERLFQIREALHDTSFAFKEHDEFVEVVSPWGNVVRCYEPQPRFGPIALGMPYIEFDVPVDSAAGIGDFYREIFGTRVESGGDGDGRYVTCAVGNHQSLIFRERETPVLPYDGHHIQIYLLDFSGPYERLRERELITEESNQWQYRFRDIIDLQRGGVLYSLEHEVRSMTHPLYGRTLVNRDPSRSNRNFAHAREELAWTLA